MHLRRPLIIGSDLSVQIPGARVRLTPREGFEAGANLMRAACYRMAAEEVERAKATKAKQRSRPAKRGAK